MPDIIQLTEEESKLSDDTIEFLLELMEEQYLENAGVYIRW